MLPCICIGEEGIVTAIAEKGLQSGAGTGRFCCRSGLIVPSAMKNLLLPVLLFVMELCLFQQMAILYSDRKRILPGNGSLTSVITVSTQTEPIFIGKPESIIMEQALKVIGTNKEDTLMIGDNYDTDIMAGMNAGMDTLLVHTGVTTKELLSRYEKKPTYVLDSLDQWTFE